MMQSGTQAQIPKGEFRKKSTALVLPITFQQFMLAIVSATYLICGFSQIYLCIMKNSNLAAKTMHISCAAATAIARLAELLWIICELSKKDRIKVRPAYMRHPDKSLQKGFLYTASLTWTRSSSFRQYTATIKNTYG